MINISDDTFGGYFPLTLDNLRTIITDFNTMQNIIQRTLDKSDSNKPNMIYKIFDALNKYKDYLTPDDLVLFADGTIQKMLLNHYMKLLKENKKFDISFLDYEGSKIRYSISGLGDSKNADGLSLSYIIFNNPDMLASIIAFRMLSNHSLTNDVIYSMQFSPETLMCMSYNIKLYREYYNKIFQNVNEQPQSLNEIIDYISQKMIDTATERLVSSNEYYFSKYFPQNSNQRKY